MIASRPTTVSSAKNTVSGAVRVTPFSSASVRARNWKRCSASASCARLFTPRVSASSHRTTPADRPREARNLDYIGQVVFAGGICIANGSDKIEENLRVCAYNPRITKGYDQFLICCILEFNNPVQRLAVGDQATIAARIGGVKPQDDHSMTHPRLAHGSQRLGANKGGVAIQHDHIAGRIGQQGGCLCYGMGGAKLFGLQGHKRLVIKIKGGTGDRVGPVACDNHGAIRVKAAACGHGMVQKRAAANLVQYLGQVGIHPRTCARSQNNQ